MGATVVTALRCPVRETGDRRQQRNRVSKLRGVKVWQRVVWKIILRNIFARSWHKTGLLLQNRSIYLEDRAEINRAWSALGRFLRDHKYHRALKPRSA